MRSLVFGVKDAFYPTTLFESKVSKFVTAHNELVQGETLTEETYVPEPKVKEMLEHSGIGYAKDKGKEVLAIPIPLAVPTPIPPLKPSTSKVVKPEGRRRKRHIPYYPEDSDTNLTANEVEMIKANRIANDFIIGQKAKFYAQDNDDDVYDAPVVSSWADEMEEKERKFDRYMDMQGDIELFSDIQDQYDFDNYDQCKGVFAAVKRQLHRYEALPSSVLEKPPKHPNALVRLPPPSIKKLEVASGMKAWTAAGTEQKLESIITTDTIHKDMIKYQGVITDSGGQHLGHATRIEDCIVTLHHVVNGLESFKFIYQGQTYDIPNINEIAIKTDLDDFALYHVVLPNCSSLKVKSIHDPKESMPAMIYRSDSKEFSTGAVTSLEDPVVKHSISTTEGVSGALVVQSAGAVAMHCAGGGIDEPNTALSFSPVLKFFRDRQASIVPKASTSKPDGNRPQNKERKKPDISKKDKTPDATPVHATIAYRATPTPL